MRDYIKDEYVELYDVLDEMLREGERFTSFERQRVIMFIMDNERDLSTILSNFSDSQRENPVSMSMEQLNGNIIMDSLSSYHVTF